MERDVQHRAATGGSAGLARLEANESSRKVQLKEELKSLSYRDGRAALSPQAGATVQREETAPPEDKNVAELKRKVADLVNAQFGGDYMKAFTHYAGADGTVSRDDLYKMLADAGVGNRLTRGMWVDGVMEKVDSNADAVVTQAEFLAVLQS